MTEMTPKTISARLLEMIPTAIGIADRSRERIEHCLSTISEVERVLADLRDAPPSLKVSQRQSEAYEAISGYRERQRDAEEAYLDAAKTAARLAAGAALLADEDL